MLQQDYPSFKNLTVYLHDEDNQYSRGDVSLYYDDEEGYFLEGTFISPHDLRGEEEKEVPSPHERERRFCFLPENVQGIKYFRADDHVDWVTVDFRGSMLSSIHLTFKENSDTYAFGKRFGSETGVKPDLYQYWGFPSDCPSP